MLPLVKSIVSDVVELAHDVAQRSERLEHLVAGRKMSQGDPYHDELSEMKDQLDRDVDQLRQYLGELQELGVEPKNALEGLIDFPTQIDGRPAYLCWKFGEPQVRYWHELDAGFSGRQPLSSLEAPPSRRLPESN